MIIMFFSGNKPNISFREFKSYGPHDLDEILSEARSSKVGKPEASIKVKPYGTTTEQHQNEHAKRSMDHNTAADALEAAAKNVHPDHAKELNRLATVHREAAKAHNKASESWNVYNSSDKNRRDNKAAAKEATEAADRATNIASSPTAFNRTKDEPKAPKKPGFVESYRIMRPGTADQHRASAKEHSAAAAALSRAAGHVTAPEHTERLQAMANAHGAAAEAHTSAAEAHDKYHKSGMIGSGSNHRDAIEKTTKANLRTIEANS